MTYTSSSRQLVVNTSAIISGLSVTDGIHFVSIDSTVASTSDGRKMYAPFRSRFRVSQFTNNINKYIIYI